MIYRSNNHQLKVILFIYCSDYHLFYYRYLCKGKKRSGAKYMQKYKNILNTSFLIERRRMFYWNENVFRNETFVFNLCEQIIFKACTQCIQCISHLHAHIFKISLFLSPVLLSSRLTVFDLYPRKNVKCATTCVDSSWHRNQRACIDNRAVSAWSAHY